MDRDETKATAQTRDGCSGGNTGTGQAFDFARPPDPGDEVLGLWRRHHAGLQRTALLGLPPPEDQRLARDRAADAGAGIAGWFRQRDEGVLRRPGGLPYKFRGILRISCSLRSTEPRFPNPLTTPPGRCAARSPDRSTGRFLPR